MYNWMGVDPGKTGALAVINEDGLVAFTGMPSTGKEINEQGILEFITTHIPKNVCIEKIHAVPIWGVVPSFKLGTAYGLVRGMCAATQTPYFLVMPSRWKATILDGLDWKKNKQAAVDYVLRAYPEKEKLYFPKNKHTMLAISEAICMAEMARRAHVRAG